MRRRGAPAVWPPRSAICNCATLRLVSEHAQRVSTMTNPLGIRDLARQLLSFEADGRKSFASTESVMLGVYEKFRLNLSEVAGVAGFRALAFRALTQAKSEAPALWAVRIAEDGSLRACASSIRNSTQSRMEAANFSLAMSASFSLPACSASFLFSLANH